jgi:hypothetical protein
MTLVVVALGLLMIALAVGILINPLMFKELMGGIRVSTPLRLMGGITRLFIGVGLISFASEVAEPWLVQSFGVLFVVVGVSTLVVSNATAQAVLERFSTLGITTFRLMSIPAAGFGAVLVYASGFLNT